MNIKYNLKFTLFLCVAIFCTCIFTGAVAELNSEVPALEKIFDLSKKPTYPPGTKQVYRGISALSQNILEREFKKTLEENGFNYRKDKEYALDNGKRMRFDRDDLVIDINLFDFGGKGTRIVAKEYLASEASVDSKDLVNYVFGSSATSSLGTDEFVSIIKSSASKEAPKYKLPKYDPALSPDIKTSKAYLGPIDIPPPPDGEILSNKLPNNMVGGDASGKIYHTKLNAKQVEEFYLRFFKSQGFVQNKSLNFNILAYKRIRFERSDIAVEVYITARLDNSCEVTVVKYSDRTGMTKMESDPFASVVLPKQDNENSYDLEDIPRPENSVRYSGSVQGRGATITYLLPMTVEEAYNFYRNQMSAMGWKMTSQMDTSRICNEYDKAHRGAISLVPSVFVGKKLDIGTIIKNSYMLEFESNDALAKIMIYPNFVHQKSGSISYILYGKKQRRK